MVNTVWPQLYNPSYQHIVLSASKQIQQSDAFAGIIAAIGL